MWLRSLYANARALASGALPYGRASDRDSGPAKDYAQDVTDADTGIARSATIVVVATIVVTSILAKACVIASHETISKGL